VGRCREAGVKKIFVLVVPFKITSRSAFTSTRSRHGYTVNPYQTGKIEPLQSPLQRPGSKKAVE